jgi:hypothetical protein
MTRTSEALAQSLPSTLDNTAVFIARDNLTLPSRLDVFPCLGQLAAMPGNWARERRP